MKNQQLPERDWEKRFYQSFPDLPKARVGNEFIVWRSISSARIRDIHTFIVKVEQAAYQRGRENFHKHYSGKPIKHEVPCNDCGSDEWIDWILPHPVFNAVCPGGNGYLCLQCFVKRQANLHKK